MPEDAKSSFAKISRRSPFALDAVMEEARAELDMNRLGAAEPYLLMVKNASGRTGLESIESLLTIYKIEGRYDEARLLLQDSASRYPDKMGVVKELATIDSVIPYPIDRAKAGLARSYQADPKDDRVWIGLANLERLQGNFANAQAWINQALKKRPQDPAVWKSNLRLARAQENVAEIKRSLEQLQSTQLQANELFDIQVWLAAKSNDLVSEQSTLRAWIEAVPGAAYPVERLSEIEQRAGPKVTPSSSANGRLISTEFERSTRFVCLSEIPQKRQANWPRWPKSSGGSLKPSSFGLWSWRSRRTINSHVKTWPGLRHFPLPKLFPTWRV